jgi:hypothetical protein
MKMIIEYDDAGTVTRVAFVNAEFADNIESIPERGKHLIYQDAASVGLSESFERLRGAEFAKKHDEFCKFYRVEEGKLKRIGK